MTRKITNMELTKGMSGSQILETLHDCVSGETSQDYVLFESIRFEHIPNEKDLHEVLISDDKYALIRKNNYKRLRHDGLKYEYEYYLCGVNDEQTYFVKKLDNFETEFPVFPENMDVIVNHLNKADKNYQRLQGDVLYKTLDFSEIIFETETICEYDNLQFYRLTTVQKTKGIRHKKIQTQFSLWGDPDEDIFIFGNHVISTDGFIFINEKPKYLDQVGSQKTALDSTDKVIIVKGSWMRLDHNQHQSVETKLVRNQCMLLEPQLKRESGRKWRNNYD